MGRENSVNGVSVVLLAGRMELSKMTLATLAMFTQRQVVLPGERPCLARTFRPVSEDPSPGRL